MARRGGRRQVGEGLRGEAGICSLSVAWPSRFTGQYGRWEEEEGGSRDPGSPQTPSPNITPTFSPALTPPLTLWLVVSQGPDGAV